MASLDSASRYIETQLRALTSRTELQEYSVFQAKVRNVIASFGPVSGPRIIVGAHYDVAGDQPGADDNASGVAGLLELARMLSGDASALRSRVDLIAYTLEEPPFFGTRHMGSYVHAGSLRTGEVRVRLMVSLEMIGYFTDREGSQSFPIGLMKFFYPRVGNFIGVVCNLRSHGVTGDFVQAMRKGCRIPVERLTAPRWVPGVDFSDHLNYWRCGYRALMITDTAFFRNPHYHEAADTPESLDYARMAEVVNGVYAAVHHLAQ